MKYNWYICFINASMYVDMKKKIIMCFESNDHEIFNYVKVSYADSHNIVLFPW
jgi:hypothetical protein